MRPFFLIAISFSIISCEETRKETDGTDLVSDTGTPGVIETDTADTADTGFTDECAVSISFSNPEPESTNFFYRDPIRVTLSDTDASATISVRSISGDNIGDVGGSFSIDGAELVFMPDAPLTPETAYVAYVSTCEADIVHELPFTTSSFGMPITDSLMEKTFAFNFGTGRMEPIEFQASLDGMVDNFMLLSALSQNGMRVQYHIGSSVDGDVAQDYCAATSTTSDPIDVEGIANITVELPNVPFRSKEQALNLRNFSFSYTLSPDAQTLSHGYWTAEADMREFALLLNQASYDMCNNYFPTFGVSCIPCSTDQDPSCIMLSMYDVEVESFEKNINCIDMDQCHLECQDNLPECSEPQTGTCE